MRTKRTLRSRESILVLFFLLAACSSPPKDIVGLSIVTSDIEECNKLKMSSIPKRDLTEAEVEALWKQNRYVAVAKSQCLNRMIIGDQSQSKK